MPRQIYTVDSTTYTVAPDVDMPLGQRSWALVQARVIDELTGLPPITDLTVTSSNLSVSARIAEGGIAGLAGIPVKAFSQLAATSCTADLSISADRYIPVDLQITITQIPTFPELFDTTDIGQVNLHRSGTIITGRIAVSSGVTSAPAAGASVAVTGIWKTVPPANVVVPPIAPEIVSLMPSLYFARSAAGTNLTVQPITPVVGADKQLLADALQATALLRLSDCIGLAIGDVLAVDADDPFRTEYMTIQKIFAASTPDQPAKVQLTYSLQTPHRFKAPVRKVTLGPAGASTTLAADSILGDVCAFVGNVATLQPAAFVAISDGVNPNEYHAVSYFTTTADAQGFYTLPMLSRVAQLNLEANVGALPPPITVTFSPIYSQETNKLDVTF